VVKAVIICYHREMQEIEIIGARKHNLKNLTLQIPKKQLICITGVSGSGKSSIAFDTIFQEGQRKYLESLSIYARQFMKSLQKPEVQIIKGISPTISIDQKHSSFYYNSTVGTISEVNHYLRLLMARAGKAHCPDCNREIKNYSPQQVSDYIFKFFYNETVYIYAPVVRNRKGVYKSLFEKYIKRGFLKTSIDGKIYYLDDLPPINRHIPHDISILIDAVFITEENKKQIDESIALASFESNGEIIILRTKKEYFFSNKLYCPQCHISIKEPQPASFSLNSPLGVCSHCKGKGEDLNGNRCQACQGNGYSKRALSFYFKGKNIFELGDMEIPDLLNFFLKIELNPEEESLLSQILPQIIQRLRSFVSLNLGYIALNRKIQTLSGGELQRTRLISQLGFSLSGIIYILDEPSIGLHISEQLNLLKILKQLKAKGNTIIIVEHDEQTIKSSDFIVDLGPGAGEKGGYLTYCGWFKDFHKTKYSLTADYIYKRKEIKIEKPYKRTRDHCLEITGININNIKDAHIKLPLNSLIAVTGISGSGKSSLIIDALYPILRTVLGDSQWKNRQFSYKSIKGVDKVSKVMMVNQVAIGKNSRSCPATYIKIMPIIRQLFAGLPEAKVRGYGQERFSYNVSGGRCEACLGLGLKKLEMSFLPELEVPCPVCEGRRFNSETLKVKYKELSIADVLMLTADEAYKVFKNIPSLAKKLKYLADVGLGYLRLGQSSVTLSGGESQRIKLTRELSHLSKKPTIYLMDEPTIGLHFDDIRKLIDLFHGLIMKGNTVVVIEHNMEIIRAADYIIDLGPGGGKNGGKILYQGELKGIFDIEDSVTGGYLKSYQFE